MSSPNAYGRSHRPRAIELVTFAVSLMCQGCLASQRTDTARGCVAEWGSSHMIRGPSQTSIYVESGEVIEVRDTLWIFGAPTLAWDDRGSPFLRTAGDSATPHFAGARFSVRDDSTLHPLDLLPLPTGVWRMRMPRVAAMPNGSVHAAFTVPAPDPGQSNDRVVWSSSWRNGAWSASRAVFDTGARATWSSSTVSSVSKGTNPLLTVVGTQNQRSAIHVFRLTDSEGWQVQSIRHPYGVYGQLLEGTSAGRLLFSFVDAGSISGRNTVFFHHSVDGGSTWGPRVEFGSKDSADAYSPVLIRAPESTLHLVWLERRGESASTMHVRHATSNDDGQTWVAREPLIVPFVSHRLVATASATGELHVLTAQESAPGTQLLHSLWNGQWTTTVWTLPNRVVGYPSLAVQTSGRTLVLWGMTPGAPVVGDMPRSWYRLGRTGCRS